MAAPTDTLKARPTVYKSIRMRSRLEAGYAWWLDQWGFTWEYEPCAFSDDSGQQYLPDFVIRGVEITGRTRPADVYVEVKPTVWAHDAVRDVKILTHLIRKMAAIRSSEPDAALLLECPSPNDHGAATTLMIEPRSEDVPPMVELMSWAPGPAEVPYARPALVPVLARSSGPWFGEWWKGQVD